MKIEGKLIIRNLMDSGVHGVIDIPGLASNPITDINFSKEDFPKVQGLLGTFPFEAKVTIEIPEVVKAEKAKK